ncbi:MAG: WYL domain-containing protein, partial [Veillonella sp.]|nr:WYL domain-containing protein [Veillonella sp.]
NIDLIEEAIQKGRKISLAYCQPDVDKRLHINLGPDHKERKYVFNPFQLVMNRGHYYLVGNHENYDDMSTLRVDRIAHITVLNERRKPLREIKGYQQQRTFNVSQYVKEHIYMFGGESITVTFKAKRSIVNQILDWFDGNVEFTNITADNVVCRVRVNHDAFKYWALQYMQSVKVLTPASLVTEVKAAIEEGLHQYS